VALHRNGQRGTIRRGKTPGGGKDKLYLPIEFAGGGNTNKRAGKVSGDDSEERRNLRRAFGSLS